MFAKLNNTELVFAPKCIVCTVTTNGKNKCYQIFNPNENQYLQAGYYPIVLCPLDTYNENSFYKRVFSLKNNTIYGEWVECTLDEALEYEETETLIKGGMV